jgi:hypothetical protein
VFGIRKSEDSASVLALKGGLCIFFWQVARPEPCFPCVPDGDAPRGSLSHFCLFVSGKVPCVNV